MLIRNVWVRQIKFKDVGLEVIASVRMVETVQNQSVKRRALTRGWKRRLRNRRQDEHHKNQGLWNLGGRRGQIFSVQQTVIYSSMWMGSNK